MSHNSTEYIAGISASPQAAHIVVMRARNGERQIVHAREHTNDGASGDLWYLEPLLSKKQSWFRKVSRVCLALENSSVALHGFPLDTSLPQVERNEQVQWELSNFVKEYRAKDHVADVHLLADRAH